MITVTTAFIFFNLYRIFLLFFLGRISRGEMENQYSFNSAYGSIETDIISGFSF